MRSGSVWYEQWPEAVKDAMPAGEAETVPRDRRWHRVPGIHARLGVREVRFTEFGIVQAISSDKDSPLLAEMRNVDPPQILDDAAWTISLEEGSKGPYYSITSQFAVTHGPFDWLAKFDDLLAPYGLGIEPRRLYIRGEAYFPDVETGCFADAVKRLCWLETFFLELNQRVEGTCSAGWGWLEGRLSAGPSEGDIPPDEMIEPPELLSPMMPKTVKRQHPGQRLDIPRIDDL